MTVEFSELTPGQRYAYRPQRKDDHPACVAQFIACHPDDGACLVMESSADDDTERFFTCERFSLSPLEAL